MRKKIHRFRDGFAESRRKGESLRYNLRYGWFLARLVGKTG